MRHREQLLDSCVPAAQANPWMQAEEQMRAGSVLQGHVVACVDYGLFVKLSNGFVALAHRTTLPHQSFELGQAVTAEVLTVDARQMRIAVLVRRVLSEI